MEMSDVEKTPERLARRKGGLRTMPFVIANEAFEKIASFGLLPNMILYLTFVYHFDAATGTSILFIWGAASNFMPILGAFISDSYLGRFLVIGMSTIISLTGLILLWLTAILKQAKPPPCDPHKETCIKPNAGQIALLFTSFVLMSIGAGGIRPCSLAFGADQFDKPENPNNERILQSFFSWYYASVGLSLMISITVIVYIQTEFGWIIGFGVPVGLMLVSAIIFFLGTNLYIKEKPNKSLFTGFAQVIAAAWMNKHIDFPLKDSDGCYYRGNNSKLVAPTQRLRFLNKACIIQNMEKDLNADASASDPWSLCTIQQVEQLKSLIKVLPMWSTGIVLAVTLSQHSFPVLQANTLNRHFIGNFKIPAGSFSLFGIFTLTLWIATYDRILVPFISKYTKNPRGIPVEYRMGIGLLISCLATTMSALVEKERRARALEEGLAEFPKAVVNMSAMWLVPQHCLSGLAEAFNAIGQIEYYYSELPKNMSSVAVALFTLGFAIANLIATFIVTIVDHYSKKGGQESWVSTNLNKGHYDYYWWILTILSVVNVFYYIICSCFYGNLDEEKVWNEDKEVEVEDKNGALIEMAKSPKILAIN
ncbi:protein NRT1/ PTR FAMILY 1.2-like [Olea europaea var. sylvestris]|uniref:NRT1 PTR FAMILY -like n=1 Tax=Olea europaea subsp. europaea TaxID=158383 RepID=A0A8S0T3P4_OLEEU|nr:protein NRT1/ PTR FAMILY 1.2-like [Olea europaea var. sylvestris]CAA2999442.1 NRT1 PTR FAMILY -like [Olea europaea subsp. europaea]